MTTTKPRALAIIATAALAGIGLTGCVFTPMAAHAPTSAPTETTTPAETTTQEPAQEPVALSAEDKFLEETQDAITLPVMTDEMERLMLEVGYSACDIYAEGIDKDFIIIVMKEAIAPYPDVYTPRAATIITDAALTHLC